MFNTHVDEVTSYLFSVFKRKHRVIQVKKFLPFQHYLEGAKLIYTVVHIGFKSESESVLQVSEHEVCNEFLRLSSAKSAGPDNVTPRLLKLCAKQLAKVFTIIFNLSFKTQLIPDIWKRSCIIPVPKKPVISCMNDLRPVALTSIPMKICE